MTAKASEFLLKLAKFVEENNPQQDDLWFCCGVAGMDEEEGVGFGTLFGGDMNNQGEHVMNGLLVHMIGRVEETRKQRDQYESKIDAHGKSPGEALDAARNQFERGGTVQMRRDVDALIAGLQAQRKEDD